MPVCVCRARTGRGGGGGTSGLAVGWRRALPVPRGCSWFESLAPLWGGGGGGLEKWAFMPGLSRMVC